MTNNDSKANIWSFLLALYDFNDSLTDDEQNTFKRVGKELRIQSKAWESHIQPVLLTTVQNNPQLNSLYQFYRKQLAKVDIGSELLPKPEEIKQLISHNSDFQLKGFRDNQPAKGYKEVLNNVVIVVCESDKSEEVVKKISSLDKIKQFISKL